MGQERYPEARELTITADGGGSNGHRVRLWKLELARLADETGLDIRVCHFPPGTSKWNKIEHRLFSFITMNWRGRPLVSHEVIVNLIAATKTKSGLAVRSELWRRSAGASSVPATATGGPTRNESEPVEPARRDVAEGVALVG